MELRQAAGEYRKALDRAEDTTHLNGWVSRAMAAKHAHQDALLISPRVIVPPARKGERTLSCVAIYLATGVDVRLLEDGDMRRTQLVKDGPQAEALALEWHEKAEAAGWATRLRAV